MPVEIPPYVPDMYQYFVLNASGAFPAELQSDLGEFHDGYPLTAVAISVDRNSFQMDTNLGINGTLENTGQ